MVDEAPGPVVVPDALWQRPEMLSALRRRDIAEVFALVRRYAGASQSRIGAATGFSQGRVSAIMNGTGLVEKLQVFERIADGLGMPDQARITLGLAPVLTSAAAPADSSQTALLTANGLHEVDGGLQVSDLLSLAWVAGRLDSQVDRRTMLLLAAGMTGELAAEPWERLSRALTGPGGLDEDAVERLEARTIGFHRLEYTVPARALYQALTTHLNELSALLAGNPPSGLRRRLAATAGEAATLCSWLAWDLKKPANSAAFDRVAALAAREAGHPVIEACAYAYKSYAVSDPAAAVRLIRQAQEYLPRKGDDATRSWLICREAEELAALGDPNASTLLARAEEIYTAARPNRERAWTRFFDPGRFSAFQLTTWVRLGDEHRVLAAGQAALAAADQDPGFKHVSLVYADIAHAQLSLGDATEGLTYARRALESAQRAESTWGLRHLARVESALTASRHPGAREILADIASARLSQPGSPA
ncbi:helix-turn-helix domain-containing protein [Pseudofrankia sp. DC12]|uniref:helix-turn-helix domain-containing protein n=1 Tax=Pseudofrankia sp. DC12 TaxID=683315 RepID=UPI000A6E4355|nr:helix-turn-helix domain-containing protein [Pseudofrankia sp. DC12]